MERLFIVLATCNKDIYVAKLFVVIATDIKPFS